MAEVDLYDALGIDPAHAGPAAAADVPTTLGFDPSQSGTSPPPARTLPFNVVGPSGSFWTDLKNRLATAGATAATAIGEKAQDYTGGVRTRSFSNAPKTQEEMLGHALGIMGADYYKPETEGGRLGQAALTALPFALMDPAALPAVLGGAVASQGATDLGAPPLLSDLLGLGGSSLAQKGANIGANRVLGAPQPQAGPPAPGSFLENYQAQFPGRSPYTPPMDLETARLAQEAKNQGVDLNVSQLSDNPVAKLGASVSARMPFSGANDRALGQVTNATAKSFGEDAPRLTPEVFQRAATRIGDMFNSVAERTKIPMNDGFLAKLQDYITQKRGTTLNDYMPVVERQVDNIIDTAANNGGDLGGRAYLDLTQKGGMLNALTDNPDPAIRRIGMELRGIVDEQFQQSAQPGDVATLRTARMQYRNFKTVQPLLSRADAGSATPSTGIVSPAALRNAVNNSWGDDKVAMMPTGTNTLNDLAKIGQRFLKEPGSSLTTERGQWWDIAKKAGEAALAVGAAAGASHVAGVDPGTAALSLGGLGTGLMANRYIGQPFFRRSGAVNDLVQQGLRGGAPGAAPYFPGALGGPGIAVPGLSDNQQRLLRGTAP